MIRNIKVSALKSIDSLEMNCSKLNIIAGTNSSGKSTLLQALLLFFQSYTGYSSVWPIPIGLNGVLVSLGDFRENKNFNVTSDKITIGLEFDGKPKKFAEVYFEEDEDFQCLVTDNSEKNFLEVFDDDDKDVITEELKYLSCNRIGSQDVFSKNYFSEGIGQNGEYAIYYLEQNKSKVLDQSLIKDTTFETLYAQVNYWLGYILNTTINTENIKGTDIVKASYSVGGSRNARPKNVGSGISYLISILILCLSSEKNDILIVENPEIHLHPKAQSKACDFLYFIAKSGRQIFIETHSDHFFNGIRAGIATGEIKQENVRVNFFEIDERNSTKNTVIQFGKRGQILNGPEGLFDQFDIDLDKMLGLR